MDKVVHFHAGILREAAQRHVLDAAAETAGRMSLHVREVDHEGGFLHQTGDLPLLDVLVGAFVGEVVTIFEPCCGVDRATQHLGGIAARFAAFHVPVHIGHKRLAAAIFDGLYHLAHEDRVHGGIADGIAHVQLDANEFILHPVAQMKLLEDEVQFGWQCLFRVKMGLPGGSEIYF